MKGGLIFGVIILIGLLAGAVLFLDIKLPGTLSVSTPSIGVNQGSGGNLVKWNDIWLLPNQHQNNQLIIGSGGFSCGRLEDSFTGEIITTQCPESAGSSFQYKFTFPTNNGWKKYDEYLNNEYKYPSYWIATCDSKWNGVKFECIFPATGDWQRVDAGSQAMQDAYNVKNPVVNNPTPVPDVIGDQSGFVGENLIKENRGIVVSIIDLIVLIPNSIINFISSLIM